jgi:hypothetical protein
VKIGQILSIGVCKAVTSANRQPTLPPHTPQIDQGNPTHSPCYPTFNTGSQTGLDHPQPVDSGLLRRARAPHQQQDGPQHHHKASTHPEHPPVQPSTDTPARPPNPNTQPPITPATPVWSPLLTLDLPSLRLQLYQLTNNTAAARTAANDALTRFELAYAAFTDAAVPLCSGDVQGYRVALQTARGAADGMFELQRVYRAAVGMLGMFVGDLGAVVWTKEEKEDDVGKGWAAVGMREGVEEIQVKLYLARVKMRVHRLEEEERRLCEAAEMHLRATGGEGEE